MASAHAHACRWALEEIRCDQAVCVLGVHQAKLREATRTGQRGSPRPLTQPTSMSRLSAAAW